MENKDKLITATVEICISKYCKEDKKYIEDFYNIANDVVNKSIDKKDSVIKKEIIFEIDKYILLSKMDLVIADSIDKMNNDYQLNIKKDEQQELFNKIKKQIVITNNNNNNNIDLMLSVKLDVIKYLDLYLVNLAQQNNDVYKKIEKRLYNKFNLVCNLRKDLVKNIDVENIKESVAFLVIESYNIDIQDSLYIYANKVFLETINKKNKELIKK